LQPVNRAVFIFNDRLYFWVLKPLARGYNFVLPEVARKGIRNFFSNLLTPIRFANCALQGKGKAAAEEFARLITNTTLGLAGFWDPASKLYGIEINDEDLGQTLGAYGIGNGFYLVWPVLGPSSLRDTAGFFGDLYVNPINYIEPTSLSFGVGLYRRFNDLSLRIGDYEAVKQAAVDPYIAIRDGYIQFRRSLIEQ
jgi:phospholipid-binding lipoprotein MlaA